MTNAICTFYGFWFEVIRLEMNDPDPAFAKLPGITSFEAASRR